ncbi:MAG TPA: TolC family protein [Polyangiaceae bacterium]|jgi:outer membrane protein TolC
MRARAHHPRRPLGALAIAFACASWCGVARAQAVASPPKALPPAAGPTIDEALLAPPPDSPRTLQSWDDALALIRAQSTDYARTYDNVLRAEGQSRVALAGILPSAFAQGSFTHQFFTTTESLTGTNITIPSQDVFVLGGTATWTPFNPRAIHAIGTANRVVDATQSELADKRRTIVQVLVTAMLGTLAAARSADLNRVGLRAALERLALAQGRARVQTGTELDVDRAQADADSARAVVITGDEALLQSREALGVALGSATAIAAPGSLDLAAFEKSVAATCRLNAEIEKRPDVVAARQRLDVAERAIDDVWLQFAPTLGVQSQLAWGSQVLYGPSTIWNLQGVLTVPIWDGGARYGLLRDTRAAADQARQTLVAARVSALVNVTQAKRAVSVSAASLDVARRQRETAQRVDDLTRKSYALGLVTSLELVTSGQALRIANINQLGLEFQALQARVQATLANADCSF